MSQDSKPREYYINDKGAEVYQHDRSKKHFECSTRPTWKNETHVVEKSALDIAVAALKFYADKNNHTIRRGGESDTRMRLDKGSTAREALKAVGEEV